MPRHFIIFAALSSLASAQDKITYDDQVLPLFQQSCLNCHNPDKIKGGLDLSTFAAAMKGSSGGKIVEPGDTGSTLISVVRQTVEPKMPPEGEKLSNEQIQVLKKWIEGGLLENTTSSARKPSKPKFELAPRSDPATKPDGPPPMPEHLLLEPSVVTTRTSAVRALATSPWAPLLAVTGQRQVLLYHTGDLQLVGILPFPEGNPASLAFTPDARYLIVGGGVPGKSGFTVTFDVTNGSRLLRAGKEFDTVLAADIRPGFDIVATGGPSRLLKLWNTETGAPIQSIKKHTDWITALDISPDGVLVASGDRNGGVWVWEAETGNEFHTLRAHQAAITAAVFRTDSNILATASEDGTVRFWEMNGGSEVKKIDAHPGGVTAFAFARDGSSLSVGRDLMAKLWKPDFNHARDISRKLPALPTAAALDAEGKRAFIGDAGGKVLVFNTSDGKPLGDIPSNPPSIASRLASLNTRISDQQETVSSAQADAATAACDAAKASLANLYQARKHWAAAFINAQALTAHHLAESSSTITEDTQVAFTAAAENVAKQAESLNRKRRERIAFASTMETANSSPETRAEILATLTALDLVIARELDAFHQAEAGLEKTARGIDPIVRLAVSKKLEAEALIQAYHKALE